MESSAKTRLPLHSIELFILRRHSASLSNLVQSSLLHYLPKGEKVWRRAYISLTSIRFWRFMPKGEKVLAQSKRTAPPPISKCLNAVFQLVIKKFFNWYLIFDIISNWYDLFQNKYLKPSWTLRGEFHWGGVLFSQRKSIWNRGENFKSWKCFSKSHSYIFDYLQKDFEKGFPKTFAKTKQVVQAWSKILRERKQSMHILWKCKLV